MRRLSVFLFGLIAIASVCEAGNAQRYKDVVFEHLKIDSVQYRVIDGRPLFMDVYQPDGDTAIIRPLVIFAHGGSFIHGNRKCDRLPAMCRYLAERGYVAVSIDYRLATLVRMASKASAFKVITKSVADGRASVAWFLNDIEKGNTYRVDKNKIFFGGSSAGAILAEHLGFIDSASECNRALCKAVTRCLPDSDALPAHALRGIISLAGAILDTNLIGANQTSLLHIHTDADAIVPYGNKRPMWGLAPFKLAGLQASRPRYISQHLNFTEYVFPGLKHTPWDADDAIFETVMKQVVEYLDKELRR
jgi:predicted esterase